MRSALTSGFAVSTSPTTIIKSSVGETFVGISSSINTTVATGFLVDTFFRGTLVSINESLETPGLFVLHQNYPNPFNPTTNIKFELPTHSFVSINVYNVLGQLVVTLVNEEKQGGTYNIMFDASHLSSGVYFYRIQTKSFIETKKFILLR
jgi:hypothetical protein